MSNLASLLNPSPTPVATAAPTAAPAAGVPTGVPSSAPSTPAATAGATKKWKEYLRHPAIQSAMLQFSINMMQPRAPGQSTLGHIGQSIGAGGEASKRVLDTQKEAEQQQIENQQKQRELEAADRRNEIAAEGNEIQRENIASDAQIAQERNETSIQIANIGVEGAMRQLQTEITARQKIENLELLTAVMENEFARYETESENAALGGAPARAPSLSDMIQQYNILLKVSEGGGTLPDDGPTGGIIQDQEVVDLLTSDDPNMQSEGIYMLGLLSPAQRTRIQEAARALKPTAPETESEEPAPAAQAAPSEEAPRPQRNTGAGRKAQGRQETPSLPSNQPRRRPGPGR